MKVVLTALLLALPLTAPAHALSQLQLQVVSDLKQFGYEDVDVTTLSSSQLAHIKHLASSDHGVSEIRGQIRAVLGESLLKTLFK